MEPDSPLSRLATSRLGAPAALLDTAGEGVLYGSGDCEALLVPWEDPVLATPLLYCPWSSPSARSPRFPLAGIRAAQARHWPRASALLVRVEGEEPPSGAGWQLRRVMVERRLPGREAPAGPDGVRIRRAGAEHRVAVLGMLLAALRKGYEHAPEEASPRVERALEVVFARELEAGRMRALVALAGGEVAGHAVYRPRAIDDLDGTPYVELVDTYVLPGFEGTGLARLLTAHVEAEAGRVGLPLLGEIICDAAGDWRVLYGNLRRAGWTPAWTMWRTALEEAGAAEAP